MKFLKFTLVALSLLATWQISEARFPRGAVSGGSAFNGKKLQTNVNNIQSGGDFPWLNVLKGAQVWSFNSGNAPVTPDILDADGYLISSAGNAAFGISTTFFMPSQQQKPGAYIIKWTGDGTVTSGSTNATAVSYSASSITQSGGVQTVNLSSAPSAMSAGQPITIGSVTSAGTWTSFNGTWRVQDVNTGCSNCFRINTGVTYTSTPSGGTATFTTTTTVGNVVGNLNGSGRYAIQPTTTIGGANGSQGYVAINAIASSVNYPHDIKFVHINEEAALDAGGEFTSTFLAASANFGVHRFLNWQYGQKQNGSNVTTWGTRKPRTYFAYEASQMRSDLYAGATTGLSGRTFTANAPAVNSTTGAAWAGLTDKSTIHVLFAHGSWQTYTATNAISGATITITGHTYVNGDQVAFFNFSSNLGPSNVTSGTYYFVCNAVAGTSIQISTNVGCTGIITPNANFTGTMNSSGALFINIGFTGAKKFYPPFVNSFIDNQWPEANNFRSLATLTYDAVLDAYIMYGGSVDWQSQGIINGVPYESELSLCTLVGAHPYFVTPVLAADPMTDFMPSLMKYVKDNKPSWMIPRYEPPNELWNTQFPQTAYATAKAVALWAGSGNYYEWYGKALSTLGQAAAVVHGGLSNLGVTYQVIGAVQTSIAVTGDLNNSTGRFAATQYVAAGTVQSPLTGSWGTITFTATPAAVSGGVGNVVSHLATAQYFASNAYFNFASGTQTIASLDAAFKGSNFTASSIAFGVMTVVLGPQTSAAPDAGNALQVGMTVYVPNNGGTFTITSLGTGTGGAGTYNISNGSLSIAYQQSYLAGVDTTAPTKLIDSVVDTVVNATIVGNVFTVNSVTSGATINQFLYVYGGSSPPIAWGSGTQISNVGVYPNLQLYQTPGNQTGSFTVGDPKSLTGNAKEYLAWANWIQTNFGINKMTGYEGSYSNDFYGSASGNILIQRSKMEANTGTYIVQSWNNFRGVGVFSYPVGFTAEFPSVFNMTGVYPMGGAWSAIDDIYQTPVSPTWQAIQAY